MADLRVLQGVKIVDADTPANSTQVSAAGNLAVELLVALPTGANTIGAVTFDSAETEGDDDSIAFAQTSLRSINLLYGSDGAAWERITTDGAGSMDVNVTLALPTGANTIGAVTLAEHGELDDDPVAVNGALIMSGLVFDDTTPVVVEEGDAGYQRMSLNRNAYTVLRDDAGNERGANVTAANELTVLATAQPGVDIGDVDILSIIPGVGATNLGKAESAAHTSADVGVMSLGVRVDAETPLAADGQYIPFMMSSVGRLLVETQGGAGGTSETDSDPFTPATDAYVPVGGIFDDVAPADLVEGDGGVVRMSAVREMYMNIRDGAGGERSANVTAAFELNVIATAQPGVDIGDVDILSGPTGASAFEVQGTAADGAAAVGNPVLVAGEESGGNIQSLLTDSDGHLQVDILTGGGSDTPTSPVRTFSSSTDTAAASFFNADGPDSDGTTTKLTGFDALASVPMKIEVQTVADGTGTTINVLFAQAGESVEWRAPHRDFYSVAHPTNAGLDGFRLVLTNLDNENAANLYGTLYTED